MKKLLVILGSTATGKTDLSIQLAKKFNGELVSCDSRQVYKGLDLGTGKLPGGKAKVKKGEGFWEINGVKVWMYDAADPKTRYTVKDYIDQADAVIEDIIKRGKLPIIVGGTGFYLKALLEGLPNLEVPVDEKIRRELEGLSLKELQDKLKLLSPIKWKSLNNSDQNNPRRLLRSIELIYMNPNIHTNPKSQVPSSKFQVLKIGLTAPREVLKKRIFDRLLARLDQGMIEEAKQLHQEGLSLERMKELGLEYGMLARLLTGEIDLNQLISRLSTQITQYSKRQLTWFKNQEKEIFWFDITDKNYLEKVEKLASRWYHLRND